MIDEMNVCTGVTTEGPCGGQDISWSKPIIKDNSSMLEVTIESKCNTCSKTEKHVMSVLDWVSPVLIDNYNKKNPVA